MTEPRLSTEQQRALTISRPPAPKWRDAGPAERPRLLDASTIAGLVNRGLVTLKAEKVLADGKLIAIAKVRIMNAGRNALAAED